MQNKGFVRLFAVLLTLVCVFYLSFSFVTRHYMKQAAEYANGDYAAEQDYIDSLANTKVWLGYTLKECREQEINLGLDLKGGMNVILEVSVPEVIKALADHKTDENFNQALAAAAKQAQNSNEDVITLFVKEYQTRVPGGQLAEIFATQQLKDKVNTRTSNADVEKVLREEVKAAVANSFNVLRTRIDRFGVVQPNIQSLEDKMGRIMVELPGIKEPERVRKLLQGSANLEFWETFTAKEVSPSLQSADNVVRNLVAQETPAEEAEEVKEVLTPATGTTSIADSLAAALKGETKADQVAADQLKKDFPLLSILQLNPYENSPVVGYANYKDTATINKYLAMPEVKAVLNSNLRLKWGVAPADFDPLKQTFELYAIRTPDRSNKAPLEGDVINNAQDDFDQFGKPSVSMSMNQEGARRWAQLTKKNINRSIAIVLDGYVYSAPNVQNEITGGSSVITGHFTPEQSKDLANVLKSGKMPAPAIIVQEDIVGPSLGQESINAGIFSFVMALILLMIYMCCMYGLVPGMIANAALFLNFFFTLGILSSFHAALTMSGIAGMVLALGMAVDANVLIYERTKEELRGGKAPKQAITDGYSNAFSAIFDSNLTSIITGIILFNFGTGPIRGFATTLIIGILCSFFTAVFLTRLVYENMMTTDRVNKLTFSTPFSGKMLLNTHFNFMKNNRRSFIITGVIIACCFAVLGFRGLSQSIDFTGGRNYKVQFEQQVEPEQVRELLSGQFGDANTSVIAIGTDKKTVRISTNYLIESNDANTDAQIEEMLYNGLLPLIGQGTSFDQFADRDNYTGGSIISSQKVGPSIADDIRRAAMWSVAFALIAIGLYILIRFRNIAYSVGSVVALTCDTIMIFGVFSALWGIAPFSLEIDQTFIGAILTAIGYSINDKVVIFDRVREFFNLYPKRSTRRLFNDSLNTTLARTINTSVSTLLVLFCIFILGGDAIRSFAFAMILGVIIGTLSSLFIASPIAYEMLKGRDRREEITDTEDTV